MGLLAQEGKTSDDDMPAAKWYEMAADAGLAAAKFNLGTLYYEGNGVKKDLEKAFSLYKEVSETNEGDALFMVGRMLMEGLGTEKDPQKGLEYFGKAAAAGNPLASEFLKNIERRQNAQLITADDIK